MSRGAILAWVLAAATGAVGLARAADEPSGAREVPEAFAPFEHLVGAWKGTGIPTADRLKGWIERHRWAWTFAEGRVVGMAVTMQGDKVLAQAVLTHDPASGRYRLAGTDPAGRAVTFVGAMDGRGRMLELEREGDTPEGRERLTLWPLENKIRYVMNVDRREPGAPRFSRSIEVGMTREGEAFAAGGTAADRPRCIITGGAASMTVTYQGRAFPICCSGCRDEFQEDPETYVRKAALRDRAGGLAPGTTQSSAAPTARRDDEAFGTPASAPTAPTGRTKPTPTASTEPSPPAAPSPAAPPTAEENAAKAANLLRLGQTLERARRLSGALAYYREIVRDYPDTPQARTAASRIKALTGRP